MNFSRNNFFIGFLKYFAAALALCAAFSLVPTFAIAQTVTVSAPTTMNSSQNWSGYVAQGSGPYTSVSGTWTVPSVAVSATPSADATWVGIGGISSQDLIQAGTQTVVENGQATYQAWYEILPQISINVPLAVKAGDSVSVSILEEGAGSNQWLIVFANNTTGQQYQMTTAYTSSLSSAEWIEEMPTVSEGRLTARDFGLDNFGTIYFTNGMATQNGTSETLAGANAEPMAMLTNQNQTLATASSLGASGNSFSVTRGNATSVSSSTYTFVVPTSSTSANSGTSSPQVGRDTRVPGGIRGFTRRTQQQQIPRQTSSQTQTQTGTVTGQVSSAPQVIQIQTPSGMQTIQINQGAMNRYFSRLKFR